MTTATRKARQPSRQLHAPKGQPRGARFAVIRLTRSTGVERQIGFSRGTARAAASAADYFAGRSAAGNRKGLDTYFVREVQA